MSEVAETAIKVWGNGLAVRFTRSLTKAAGVAEGTP
jgi:antitoxin component of MazEF toxin-antitoxin module